MKRARHREGQAFHQLGFVERTADQLQTDRMQVEQLTARIQQLEEESNQVKRHLAFFETGLAVRDRVIAALLGAIADAASSQVVVNHIEQTDDQVIRIEGWALSDVAAARFADSLGTALRPLGFVLVEPAILQEKQGRLGPQGYVFELRLGAMSSATGPLLLTNLMESP